MVVSTYIVSNTKSFKQHHLKFTKFHLTPLVFNSTTFDINMKHILLVASFTLPFVDSKTSGELCRGTGQRALDGNWYCSEVWAITYRNISQTGVYNRTTFVNPSTGICGHERVNYGGTDPLTPLFGEVEHPDHC
jgi:hypothetical protein